MLKRVIQGSVLASLTTCPGAFAADFRMVAAADDNFPGTAIVATGFIQGVAAASNGSIKITKSGPEAVPPFETLRPTSAGAFQFLFTNGVYHSGTTTMGMTLDALSRGDVAARYSSGVYEALDKHYEKFNLKVVALPISKGSGYTIILKNALPPEGDLKGRKIRSTPTYGGVLGMLGATIVVQPPGEVYSSLEKGVVEGATWPALGILGTRWYEVAKYLVRPTFGVSGLMLMMNRDAWNKLSDSEKKIVLAEGRKVEDAWFNEYARLVREEEQELKAKGIIIAELPAKYTSQIEAAWAEGIWKIVEEKNGEEAKTFHSLAKSKGLTD
jgi:TRAP-type transport system periplasmic protein